MRTTKSLIIIILLLPVVAFSQPFNHHWTDTEGNLKLLGKVTVKRLGQKPFKSWYKENQQSYTPDQLIVDELIRQIENVDSITIFMGTWCGDSKREVPRMIKLLQTVDFDENKLSIICVDRSFNTYKQSPGGEQEGQNIHRVPTMIISNSNNEIGRIVESPIVSIEADMQSILNGDLYLTKYPVVYQLNKMLEADSWSKTTDVEKLKKKFFGQTHSAYELNTYGYQLLTSWEIERAVQVFHLNTLLHENEELPHLTLGKVYQLLGKKEQAYCCFQKVIAINPDNEEAKNSLKN